MSTTALPPGSRELIERMTRKFPELFVNEDEPQRTLTTRIAQQFVHVYGAQWGNKKRAGLSDDFRSKDSIAVLESDLTTSVWDMFSSGLAILVNDGDLPVPGTHANLPPSEAEFMPVNGVNWLGDAVPGPEPQPPSENLEPRVEAVEQRVMALEDDLAKLQDELAAVEATQADLMKRVDALEDTARKPLKVIGKTTASWGHQHTVNLDVTKG